MTLNSTTPGFVHALMTAEPIPAATAAPRQVTNRQSSSQTPRQTPAPPQQQPPPPSAVSDPTQEGDANPQQTNNPQDEDTTTLYSYSDFSQNFIDNNPYLSTLESLLECPVCYEKPRPGTKTMGMCNNGHIVCESCTQFIGQSSFVCPTCRHPKMRLYKDNHFFSTVIRMVTYTQEFICQHAPCQVICAGFDLEAHQSTCQQTSTYCPVESCQFYGPFEQIAKSHLDCIQPVPRIIIKDTLWPKDAPMPNSGIKQWSFVLPIKDFFCANSNTIMMSPQTKALLLTDNTNPQWRLYMYPYCRFNRITFPIQWLARRQHAPEAVKKLKYKMWVQYSVSAGHVGMSTHEPIHFVDDETLFTSTNIVEISAPLFRNWLYFSGQTATDQVNLPHTPGNQCNICQATTDDFTGPHLHFYVVVQ